MANEWVDIIIFLAGLVLIIKGADWVTDYGSQLAKKLGVSELVIGLTLVAMATSLPELAVSLVSAISGVAQIATGTVIGSNISNIALILGVSALVYPLATGRKYLNQAFVTLGFSVLIAAFLIGGMLWYEGLVILVFFIGYIFYSLKHRKEIGEEFLEGEELVEASLHEKKAKAAKAKRKEKPSKDNDRNSKWKYTLFCIFGGLVVVVGAQLLVTSTVNIAQWLGVPEALIAIVIIAIGTSLPELATSVTAAAKHMRGISLGNIIGTNIFNIAVLGIVSLFSAVHVNPGIIFVGLPVMIAVTALLLIFMKTNWHLSRKEGIVLLVIYALFVGLQFVV